jgi:hypothetical protein
MFFAKKIIHNRRIQIMSINQSNKAVVINISDLASMRIQKLNNIIKALNDYLTLPDLTKREKSDLLSQIESLKEVVKFIRESQYV